MRVLLIANLSVSRLCARRGTPDVRPLRVAWGGERELVSFTFHSMDEETARTVLTWRYEEPYNFYNADPKSVEEGVKALLDPANFYYGLIDERGDVVAYCCFGPDARVPGGDYSDDALDVGGGLRPDLTGRGLGLTVFEAILDFGRQRFAPPVFRETVAAWNKRALAVCERAGFQVVQRFERGDGTAFVVLLRPARRA